MGARPKSHPQYESTVGNLSEYNLSQIETQTLEKGLGFVTTNKHDRFKFREELTEFMRKIHLKQYFEDKEDSTEPDSGLHNKSNFCPPIHSRTAEARVFENRVLQELAILEKDTEKEKIFQNLSRKEKTTLKGLLVNDSIIIRKADKGGAVVILNRKDYIDECMRQLEDGQSYQRLDENPTQKLETMIHLKVTKAEERRWITKKEAEFLRADKPRTPQFYILPKIHKSLTRPPRRPIVSGCDSVLEPLSRFADHFMQPMVREMSSFIKDTTQIIKEVEGRPFNQVEEILICLDVVSLYTNIPQRASLEVLEERLLMENNNTETPASFILWCAEVALTENYFHFNGCYYKQIQGTAMGATLAPSIANLYMEAFEKRVIYGDNNPFRNNIQVWKRYINDVLLIWKGDESEAISFFKWLNEQNQHLKFTENYSREEVNFLDVTIKVDTNKVFV
ncbi:uncharacterized protein [Ambystoma mexicanum]|uniref:uncharacterized protein n=1 Tax=Ambystoma mexicanum TaxID=8296 RepID=UPI0037E93712